MRAPSLKKRFEQRINDLSQSLGALYILTEGLTLFEPLNTVAVELAQAIEALLEDSVKAKSSEIVALVQDSDVLGMLEELQDTDWVSELESSLLDTAGDAINPELALFISELIEKIDVKYEALLASVHAFNALIPEGE